ncbi:hypothetical protein GQS52_15525 [Streptomyces sp. SCUT-3]|uniref:hypothetical protein n=1 Tax=Streptomyces sp. SCUT-3 TaxID=2684469 RepID=UPI000CBCE9D5|nr:hypothetical protein [Streptomyces sp. SCUT-3]PLW74720.1 hypothetical protein C0036_00395 [Streptomyces sp. DJ]QMV22955.1 hypothetical protein GQS52_15525 [Streptomyces sp. SCUT-3]
MPPPPRRTGAAPLCSAAVLLCSALLAACQPPPDGAGSAAPSGSPASPSAVQSGAPSARDGAPEVAFTLADERITESSGLAASPRHKGVHWTVNDSDDGPHVYAVDSSDGRTVARITMRGIAPRDVEAVSVGPGGRIWVGDVGDNLGGTWNEVYLYSFEEPARLADRTVDVVRYRVRYAGGPRDAEAVMVHPVTGRVYIADKVRSGGALHAGPRELSPSGVNTFTEVADGLGWITDGAFSPDGSRLVLRGYFSADVFRWEDGRPEHLARTTVPFQRQGESVSFTADGRALLYGSEGVRSQVWRVDLAGDRLPDSARPR